MHDIQQQGRQDVTQRARVVTSLSWFAAALLASTVITVDELFTELSQYQQAPAYMKITLLFVALVVLFLGARGVNKLWCMVGKWRMFRQMLAVAIVIALPVLAVAGYYFVSPWLVVIYFFVGYGFLVLALPLQQAQKLLRQATAIAQGACVQWPKGGMWTYLLLICQVPLQQLYQPKRPWELMVYTTIVVTVVGAISLWHILAVENWQLQQDVRQLLTTKESGPRPWQISILLAASMMLSYVALLSDAMIGYVGLFFALGCVITTLVLGACPTSKVRAQRLISLILLFASLGLLGVQCYDMFTDDVRVVFLPASYLTNQIVGVTLVGVAGVVAWQSR